MRTRMASLTVSRSCAAADTIRLADRRRTPGIRPISAAPAARTWPTVVRPASISAPNVTLFLNMAAQAVHRHRVKRVGEKRVAHRLMRLPRDLAGLTRRGKDRLNRVADRAAVGDDGAGRLPGRRGLASTGGRRQPPAGSVVGSAARATVVRTSVLELTIGPIVTADIVDTPGEHSGASPVSSLTRHCSDLRLALR